MSVDATELRRVVEHIGEVMADHAYLTDTTCLYTERDDDGNDVPGCIVGNGLHELGFKIPYTSPINSHTTVYSLYTQGYITGDANDMHWLGFVQDWQDLGYTWGAAVERANRVERGDDEF